MEFVFEKSPKSLLEVIPVLEGKGKEGKKEKGNENKKAFNAVKKNESKTIIEEKKTVFLAGMGKEESLELNQFRKLSFLALAKGKELELNEVAVEIPELKKFSAEEISCAMIEGALIGIYSFDKYKKQTKKFPEKMVFSGSMPRGLKEISSKAKKINDSVEFARNITNDNSRIVNPEFMEKSAKKLFAGNRKVKVSVLQKKDLLRQGLNLFASVGQAGTSDPRLILIEFKGNPSSKKKLLLVGKGITFDSGGLGLKPWNSMESMRDDMSGAADVMVVIKAASDLKLKVNVIGALGCAENLIDAKSYRPGDILKAFNGKTVEIAHTDAEGRLVLADTLSYCVKKFNPEIVVDYATLTGACASALYIHAAGMFSNNDALAKKMIASGKKTFERVWMLPLFEEYLEDIKGDYADLRNSSKIDKAGTISAALFLQEFIEGKPWVHLDIAGTAFMEKPYSYYAKGATGFGIRLSIEFISRLMEDELK